MICYNPLMASRIRILFYMLNLDKNFELGMGCESHYHVACHVACRSIIQISVGVNFMIHIQKRIVEPGASVFRIGRNRTEKMPMETISDPHC